MKPALTLLFWVLVHSLWQAALVWLAYGALRRLRSETPSWSASAVATLAVFAVPALSVATAVALLSQALAARPGADEAGGLGAAILAALWALAAFGFGLRMVGEMRGSPGGRGVERSPHVVGWLRPRIIIPPAVAGRLSQEQLRGVIAHEQEHIRAGDPKLNLLQCVLDAVYFFNPAYRRLSSAARLEREFRCDDAAASQVGELVYLRALVAVAGGAATPSACELSVAGHLEQRVARLADPPRASGGRAEIALSLAAIMALLLFVPYAVAVPARHVNASAWQSRMRPAGQLVRGVVTPPLQAAGHALKNVAR